MNLKDIKLGQDTISAKTDVGKYLDDMKDLDHEIMVVFGFTGDAKYVLAEDITEFSECANAQFSAEKLFKRLKETGSAGFILVHNHPSKVCVPTDTDVVTTKNIMKMAKKKKLLFLEHYTWTNGFLWPIIELSVNKDVFIDTKNGVRHG